MKKSGLGSDRSKTFKALNRCPDWQGPIQIELDDFYKSVAEEQTAPHDGKWGKATLEVCLAILQSSRSQSEQQVLHQVAESVLMGAERSGMALYS